MPSSISNVTTLPPSTVANRIGTKLTDLVPNSAPAAVIDSPLFPHYSHSWFDSHGNGTAETLVAFERGSNQPQSMTFRDGNHVVQLWSDAGTGRVDRQVLTERGKLLESLIDRDQDGEADVMIQRQADNSTVQFQKTP